MSLVAEDDDIHPRGAGDHYGENYLFAGLAENEDTGFYLHVGRLFEIGTFELHVATFSGSEMVSCLVRDDLDETSMRYAGLSYEILEPMQAWRLTFSGAGRAGMFLASGEAADTAVAFDLTLRSRVAPFDMATVFRSATFGQMLGEHYEQGFQWEGTVTIGDTIRNVTGLGVRDHSWGSRHMSAHNTTWWAPSTFDGGDTFFAGLDMRRGELHKSFASRTDASGETLADSLEVTVLEGDQVTYDRASVLFGKDGPFTAVGVERVTVPWLIGHGLLRVSDDLFCRLERPDGPPGFALLEMNRAMTAAEQCGFAVTADHRSEHRDETSAAPAPRGSDRPRFRRGPRRHQAQLLDWNASGAVSPSTGRSGNDGGIRRLQTACERRHRSNILPACAGQLSACGRRRMHFYDVSRRCSS
jgi:hypothetical protein